jgi:hypothetical protein
VFPGDPPVIILLSYDPKKYKVTGTARLSQQPPKGFTIEPKGGKIKMTLEEDPKKNTKENSS